SLQCIFIGADHDTDVVGIYGTRRHTRETPSSSLLDGAGNGAGIVVGKHLAAGEHSPGDAWKRCRYYRRAAGKRFKDDIGESLKRRRQNEEVASGKVRVGIFDISGHRHDVLKTQ